MTFVELTADPGVPRRRLGDTSACARANVSERLRSAGRWAALEVEEEEEDDVEEKIVGPDSLRSATSAPPSDGGTWMYLGRKYNSY